MKDRFYSVPTWKRCRTLDRNGDSFVLGVSSCAHLSAWVVQSTFFWPKSSSLVLRGFY